MNHKILVTHTSRNPATEQIAIHIGETLRDRGFTIDVKPAKANPDLSPYAAELCVINLSDEPYPVRVIVRTSSPCGDFSDWGAIDEWLKDLNPMLEKVTEASN